MVIASTMNLGIGRREYVEYYNTFRPCESLGNKTPAQVEKEYSNKNYTALLALAQVTQKCLKKRQTCNFLIFFAKN